MFPNLPALFESAVLGIKCNYRNVAKMWKWHIKTENTNITVAFCMWRPDSVAINHFGPITKETTRFFAGVRERELSSEFANGSRLCFDYCNYFLSSHSHACFSFLFFLQLSHESTVGQDFLGDSLIMWIFADSVLYSVQFAPQMRYRA